MRESVKGRWPLAGPYGSPEKGEDEMEERRANARARAGAGARAFLEPLMERSERRIQVAHKTLPPLPSFSLCSRLPPRVHLLLPMKA